MSEVGRVVWTDYTITGGDVLVRVSIRTESKKKKNIYVEGTEPYFFAPEDEPAEGYGSVVRTETGYESLFGHSLQKVVTETPADTGKIEGNFSWTGEADVPYYRRVAIHDGLSGYVRIPSAVEDLDRVHIDDIETDIEYNDAIEPRVLIGDIEVRIGDESFEETRKNNSQPINVICAYDTYEDVYQVFYYDKFEHDINGGKIRDIVEDQWDEPGIDIQLRKAPTETDMANDFINYVREREFDLTSGWNWVNFDNQYIIGRFDELDGVDVRRLSPFGSVRDRKNSKMDIAGLPSFDMMKGFCDKLTRSNWRSQSLDYVANEEVDVGKIEDVDINWCWENLPEKLIGYNIVDVILTVALDEANDIHNFFYEMADVCSIPIYDVFYEKRQVDGYVMSHRGDDEVLPTSEEAELIDNAGGYVADAAEGRIRNVGVSDLKSLYPSAMITWNISTETVAETPEEFDEYVQIPKVPEPKDVQGGIQEDQIDFEWLYASLDQEGIIPRTVKQLFKKRNYEKEQMYAADEEQEEDKWDRKQAATKVLMNSFYGVSSSKYWRLANRYLGDAITSTARYTLWKGRRTLDKLNYEHVYSDTDSHFFKLTEDTLEARIEELKEVSAKMDSDASNILADCGYEGKHPFLIDSDLHGDEYTCMLWEPEKELKIFMQLGKKKRYASNIDWKEGEFYDEPEISISGFEHQRSDSMEITADLQQEVIEMVLTDASFDEVSEYIQSTIEQVDSDHEDVKKFALPGSINKDLEDYPNRQVPRASMYSNEHLGYEFGEGDDPFVYMVKSTPSNVPNTDVVAFEWNEDVPEGFELDREAIIERGVKKPIEPIIEEVGWKFSELRDGKKQRTMDLSTGGENPFA